MFIVVSRIRLRRASGSGRGGQPAHRQIEPDVRLRSLDDLEPGLTKSMVQFLHGRRPGSQALAFADSFVDPEHVPSIARLLRRVPRINEPSCLSRDAIEEDTAGAYPCNHLPPLCPGRARSATTCQACT